ncbi:MAG: hypothetical protein ACRDOK_08850 [Streptosporangiaceae bacterium]
MNHYLVVFDHSTGEVLRRPRFSDPAMAISARFEEERERRGEASIEVVLLGADSWESLRRTHGRYFRDFGELAEAAFG